MLSAKDREYLLQAIKLAEKEKFPPQKVGHKPEPTWGAVLASADSLLAAEAFHPGDSKDAVAKMMDRQDSLAVNVDATLYITFEPKAEFGRLPPVTESIRKLGVRRVVVGTEDPFPRSRGLGIQTLRGMGIIVELADAEEARFCQSSIEEYTKYLLKGLPYLRVFSELDLDGTLRVAEAPVSQHIEGIVSDLQKRDLDLWQVIINHERRVTEAPKVLSYQNIEANQSAQTRKLLLQNGKMDLVGIFRDIAKSGITSLVLNEKGLWLEELLKLGLVDSLLFSPLEKNFQGLEGVKVLVRGATCSIQLFEIKTSQNFPGYLEAQPKLC